MLTLNWMKEEEVMDHNKMPYTYDRLIGDVENIHRVTSSYAKGAVNQLLTARNWMIGYYIVEFEQHGNDRAAYGANLLENLSNAIKIKGLERRQSNLCRIFYIKYPQLLSAVAVRVQGIIGVNRISKNIAVAEQSSSTEICSTLSSKFITPSELLLTRLSFSHIREIMTLDDPFERFFYETECIKGTWSVRELRRQISTNLFVRAGISQKPELLLNPLHNDNASNLVTIKDPFTFEFLGLEAKEAVSESDLEEALILDYSRKSHKAHDT